ncbi:hypothetical protein [Streptosporangium vulgare]|uniref:hypothetical protein n=1 Tax=Streptosporangium vulgare TaxID=46190 RepID=UPI0031D3FD61
MTEQTVGGGAAYHMPILVHLRGDLDTGALLAACAAVADRHPMLGSVGGGVDNELRLVPGAHGPGTRGVDPSTAPLPSRILRSRTPRMPRTPRTAESGDRAASGTGGPCGRPRGRPLREEILRAFDLEKGPLARFTLFGIAPGRHLLLFRVAHHLVFDGQSTGQSWCATGRLLQPASRRPRCPGSTHGRGPNAAGWPPCSRRAGVLEAPAGAIRGETVVLGHALRSPAGGRGPGAARSRGSVDPAALVVRSVPAPSPASFSRVRSVG